MTERERVVREALRWEGTPYHHRGRILGVGVDCAQLPAAVYESAGLIPHIDPAYTRQWYMHRDEEVFLEWIVRFAHEIDREAVKPGDLGVWKFGRTFSHSAIVIDPPVILHAVLRSGRVVRSDMDRDEDLKDKRCRKFFSLWND